MVKFQKGSVAVSMCIVDRHTLWVSLTAVKWFGIYEITSFVNWWLFYTHVNTALCMVICYRWQRLTAYSCRNFSCAYSLLLYDLVRSKREYYHNCSLVVFCVAFCSCTLIWAAHRFCLPDLASSYCVHSLCLGYFVCVRLFSCIIPACML